MRTKQYTIRGVSETLDGVAREQAEKYRTSLNSLLLEALAKGLGAGEEPVIFHDMDDLAGTWVEDDDFDKGIKSFESIDQDLWK
ncbi:MAG: hypothetical protein JXX14_11305 [Deltaproteobacteria bacterium]|nr:hypothetical protein [Deltaproteobacteria bacterium]